MLNPFEEKFDEQVFDSAFKKIAESQSEDLIPHFVYAGHHLNDTVKYFIREGVTKYNLKMALGTMIFIRRDRLITKECMENHCKGKEQIKESINDHLESLLQYLQQGDTPDKLDLIYFLPKLTKEELKLVQQKDSNYLKTFMSPTPDVNEAEMKASESKSKFVYAWGAQETFKIKNPYL